MHKPSSSSTGEISRLLAAAAQHLEARRYQEAHALCLEVLKADTSSAGAFELLAVIAADHGNHAKAVELLEKASSLASKPARQLALKARSLIALNRRAEAVAAAAAASALEPTDPYTLDTIGVAYTRAGLHDRATPLYRQAAGRGGQAGQFYNLAAALQFTGAMDEAREAYRACLARDPNHARAWSGLVQISKQTREQNDVAALEQAFARQTGDADAMLSLAHALAKTHEDLGDPATAMNWLARGKAAKRAVQPYDTVFDDGLFDAALRTAKLPRTEGYRDARPIFIVGMPRTGTTLVDRILSSHSEVTSAGELTDFALALKRMTGTPGAYVLDEATLDAGASVDLAALGKRYIESVRATLQVSDRFIDKMPLNVFLVPLILRALPEARVICMRRHSADTVLGNYRQLFATSFSYYSYAHGLEDTARYFVKFDRLVGGFRELLPANRFTEVSYEAVVDDLEGEARRILSFCDLRFESGVLDFHANAAPVATASSAQVRQPLYRTALARWKRYRPALDPALEILAAAGLLQPEEYTRAGSGNG